MHPEGHGSPMPLHETVCENGLQTRRIFLLSSHTILSISLRDALHDMAASRRPKFMMHLPASWPRRARTTTVDRMDGAGSSPASQGRGGVASDEQWELPSLSGRPSPLASHEVPACQMASSGSVPTRSTRAPRRSCEDGTRPAWRARRGRRDGSVRLPSKGVNDAGISRRG